MIYTICYKENNNGIKENSCIFIEMTKIMKTTIGTSGQPFMAGFGQLSLSLVCIILIHKVDNEYSSNSYVDLKNEA